MVAIRALGQGQAPHQVVRHEGQDPVVDQPQLGPCPADTTEVRLVEYQPYDLHGREIIQIERTQARVVGDIGPRTAPHQETPREVGHPTQPRVVGAAPGHGGDPAEGFDGVVVGGGEADRHAGAGLVE
ncbi:hypothetical protein PanWU01x14_320640, partial [Parasponia andersonii]